MSLPKLMLLIAIVGVVDTVYCLVFGLRPLPIGAWLTAEVTAWLGFEAGRSSS